MLKKFWINWKSPWIFCLCIYFSNDLKKIVLYCWTTDRVDLFWKDMLIHFRNEWNNILFRSKFDEFWWMYTLGSNTLIKTGRFPSLRSMMPLWIQYFFRYIPQSPPLKSLLSLFHMSINRIIQCVAFFLSVSIMLLRFITVVALYCCKVFTVWTCHNLIIHSSADGSLGCFQFGGNCEWRICI